MVEILKQEVLYLRNRYTLYCNEAKTDRELLEFCDKPLGAPFGGKVERYEENRIIVDVYTD